MMRTVRFITLSAALLALGASVLFAGGRKEERNMISLNMLTAEAPAEGTIALTASFSAEQLLSYSFELYASVGFDADFSISDESVIGFVERKENYKNPKRMRQGMTGSDDAEGTFVFKTLKPGKAVLTVRHLFRGDVEKEAVFTITVVP